MSFVIKKGEKLTTALYMVTDIMSEKEPMKWKLRENGIELISDIAVSFGAPASERMSVLRNAIKKIEKVISLLEIAQTARMVSEMNASVLKKEYVSFKDQVEKEWNETYEKNKNIFSTSFFDVPREIPEQVSERVAEKVVEPIREVGEVKQLNQTDRPVEREAQRVHTNTSDQRQHQGQQRVERRDEIRPTPQPLAQQRTPLLQVRNGVVVHQQTPATPPVKETQQNFPMQRPPQQTHLEVRPQHQLMVGGEQKTEPKNDLRGAIDRARMSGVSQPAQAEVGRGDRREIILRMIKEKPSLNIKDITKNFPDVSEKTIQRELLAMVASGILIKRGERRWSTYSLKEG